MTTPQFIYSILYSTLLTVVSCITINVVGFGFAWMLTQAVPMRNYFRGIFFVPNLIGGLILGYIWQFVFNDVMTQIFAQVLPNSPLGTPIGAFTCIVTVLTWSFAGYVMLIYIAALNNVPPDLIEAAKIDGAKPGKILRKIQLPLLMPAFTVTLFMTITGGFRQFDTLFSLTKGAPTTMFMGEPVYSQYTLAYDVYNTATQNAAKGQAEAVILFLILLAITMVQVWWTKSKEVDV